MQFLTHSPSEYRPWNKGRLTGQNPPLKLKEIWAIRIRLQMKKRIRDLALFNPAIDSKLRGCDLVSLCVRDVMHGQTIVHRAVILQHKTRQPVQFEITQQTQDALQDPLAPRERRDRSHLTYPLASVTVW